MPIGDFDPLGRMSKIPLSPATVDFNAVRQGASSFKLIPTQALVPGEYCLTINAPDHSPGKSPGFCFGLDAAEEKGTQ